MNLNIKAFKQLFKNTNASYKYLLFYSLIQIVKDKKNIEEISFKEIIISMFRVSWFVTFQYQLKFSPTDQIQNLMKDIFKNSDYIIKVNNPTNAIIKKIHLETKSLLDAKLNYDKAEVLMRYVLHRLIRPFYPILKKMSESGPEGLFKKKDEIYNSLENFQKFKPLYYIKENDKKIILQDEWVKYILDHYELLELWLVHEWAKYMNLYNPGIENLIGKLKYPDLKRESLSYNRNFWKKIIHKKSIKCIFTNKKLENLDFDIDHYICWNYLGHDEHWNLLPINKIINIKKSNKIPKDKFIKKFVELKKFSLECLNSSDRYLEAHQNFVGSSIKDLSFNEKYTKKILNISNTAILAGFDRWDFNGNAN